ncbi:uncharacterized protein Fot_13498 [Forsythia ovata]|uniref:Mannan endo-1,4-beta-mannosidase n=1 Tax=Forsythia ovata TaxID=205694 RepID=A0ABD1W744_9LAMI
MVVKKFEFEAIFLEVDLHKAVVSELGKNNIMVVLDNHISQPQWCCSNTDGNGFFGDVNFDPKEWVQGLSIVATTYKDNPAFGETISLTNYKTSSRFDQHQDGGPIKLVRASLCLGVAGDSVAACASNDCSSKWRSVSSSGLHLAAPNGQEKYLCLEKNAADSTIVTKKCFCVGGNLQDAHNCPQNPEF